MMVVIGTFFFCNIFATIVAMKAEADGKNGTDSNLFVSVSDLFLTLNCSINMIIYGIFGQKFRRTFRKLFFPCLKYEPEQSETRWSRCALKILESCDSTKFNSLKFPLTHCQAKETNDFAKLE